MTKPKVKGDREWKRIMTGYRDMAKRELVVGVLGGEGAYPSPAALNVATIALFNEFGTENIPERSFLRSTFDEKLNDYQRLIVRGLRGKKSAGNADLVLNVVGEKAKGDVQQKIDDIKTPPNAEATIKRKGSSNPLIDTGRMRQSIDFEIRSKK